VYQASKAGNHIGSERGVSQPGTIDHLGFETALLLLLLLLLLQVRTSTPSLGVISLAPLRLLAPVPASSSGR
jgi:hypothetical protein